MPPPNLQPRRTLQLVQPSMWSGFRYTFLDAGGTPIGHLAHPNLGQARNARLRFHPTGSGAGDIRLRLDGEHRVDFEYLSRGWVNDIRFRLLQGEEVLAHMDIHHLKGRRWPDITLQHGPLQAQLLRTGHWWRSAFELRDVANGRLVLHMQEPALIALRRRYHIEHDLPRPVVGLLCAVITSLRL